MLNPLLSALRAAFEPALMPLLPPNPPGTSVHDQDAALVDFSIFTNALERVLPDGDAAPVLAAIAERTLRESRCDAAVGCLYGLVIGDATGAPLEFNAVDVSPAPASIEGGSHRCAYLARMPDASGQLRYAGDSNTFALARGQWTDDASMALCLADSLISCDEYRGGDARARYFNWWFHGYNNAFRFDQGRRRSQGGHSIGLGGNISKSLLDLLSLADAPGETIPARFAAAGEDAGNGSMMRLAPVAIRYGAEPPQADWAAEESSYATHTGADAAACCRFMAHFMTRALGRDRAGAVSLAAFLDETVDSFMSQHRGTPRHSSPGIPRLLHLLASAPPSTKEACWEWRTQEPLNIPRAIAARAGSYNGYRVTPEYFGSYSMDALAMVLWSLHRSTTFADAVATTVNLLGDCDTTGAIAGQMAGAFFGYHAIPATPLGAAMQQAVVRWDPRHEIPLRAVFLHDDGRGSTGGVADGPQRAQRLPLLPPAPL